MPIALDHFIELSYADRDYDAATRVVPISHTGAHKWVTVPWDGEPEDPDGQHAMPGGWSILTAPADRDVYYSGAGFLRMQGGVSGCSTHLMPVHCRPALPGEVDGQDNIVAYREACEVFIGQNESHPAKTGVTYSNTHLSLPFAGRLPAGQRLRLVADYWNAPDPGSVPFKMCGATVSVFWGLAPVS